MNELESFPVLEPEQLPENPGVPVVEEKFSDVYYRLGLVTQERKNTSLSTRTDRAELYKEAQEYLKSSSHDPEQRVSILTKIGEFKRIEKEFHDQSALTIQTPEWGDLTACYTILNRQATADNPIVFITGASNGVESVDSFVRELAKRQPDRQILVLGYPDAPSGVMTEEFYEAVKNSNGFLPHAGIFKSMIQHLSPEEDFELWGYSSGAAIATTLMTDTAMSERITNASLICPWGVVKQPNLSLNLGVIYDSLKSAINIKNFSKYVFIKDPTNDEQKKWKYDCWLELGKQGLKPVTTENLTKVKLREAAKIAIVSGGSDKMTKSAQVFNESTVDKLRQYQPALEVAVVPNTPHTGPFLQPEKFVTAILEKLGRGKTS